MTLRVLDNLTNLTIILKVQTLSQIGNPAGVVLAICGSCYSLGNWNPQCAIILHPEDEAGD
ncbi:hypothetical protein L345_04364, partial [Ophiophagus hannah]